MTAFHAFLTGAALGAGIAAYIGYRWGAKVSAAAVTLKKDL